MENGSYEGCYKRIRWTYKRSNLVPRAVVRISKSNSLIKRPVNLLYPIEYKESLNVEQEVFNEQCNQRPARREAATIGELKRKPTED